MKAKFGIRLPVSGPLASADAILKIGQKADELGFDAIETHDHVAIEPTERYHNSGGYAQTVDERDKKGLPVTNFFETMTALAILAGKTNHVRLIPCAVVLPLRHPVLFAKQAITLHELSGGRFVACLAIGNIETDFRAMNIDYKKRGKMTDDYLKALNLLLNSPDNRIGYEGKYVSFPPLEFYPKPSHKMPIWVAGGFTDVAFRRTVEYGDGFLPGGIDPETMKKGLSQLAVQLKEKGRDIKDVEVGTQVFTALAKDGNKARSDSRYTIESFYSEEKYNAPDPKHPGMTLRQSGTEGMLRGAFVGSPDDVINKAQQWLDAGCSFFDMRQVSLNIDSVIEMMGLFAKEVMPSFS